MGDIIVRYIDLPCRIPANVVLDFDGDYNIYINSRLSYEEQEDAKRHEIEHILQQDFDSKESISKIEFRANLA